MDISVRIRGIDELVGRLHALGRKNIPVYAAQALSRIIERTQDALIAHTRGRLTVRGNWLTKGFEYCINRYLARLSRGMQISLQ